MPAKERPEPLGEVDARFSADDARLPAWAEAAEVLEKAEVFWISTVRPGGQPHVTPMIALWADDRLYFCTGPGEQKAKNLARNPACVITTGTNRMEEGFDVIVEGSAVRVTGGDRLRRLADAYVDKYGPDWRFDLRGDAFSAEPGEAWVFEVVPRQVFGYTRGERGAQTRWRGFQSSSPSAPT